MVIFHSYVSLPEGIPSFMMKFMVKSRLFGASFDFTLDLWRQIFNPTLGVLAGNIGWRGLGFFPGINPTPMLHTKQNSKYM